MIKVHIDNNLVAKSGATLSVLMLESLRAAGIPAAGTTSFTGTTKGRMQYECFDNTHQFTWRENDQDTSIRDFTKSKLPSGVEVFKNGMHAAAAPVDDDL